MNHDFLGLIVTLFLLAVGASILLYFKILEEVCQVLGDRIRSKKLAGMNRIEEVEYRALMDIEPTMPRNLFP